MNTQVMFNNVPTPPGVVSLAAAVPDGGLLYAGIRCINYISAPAANGKDRAKVRTMSTRIHILALDVSPLWGNPGKHFAVVGDDLSVQVWECDSGKRSPDTRPISTNTRREMCGLPTTRAAPY